MSGRWLDLGQVNLTDNGALQDASKVVGLADGRFLVVWIDQSGAAPGESTDIVGRIFDADGNGSAEIVFNSVPDIVGNQIQPDIAATPDGGFIVTYASDNDSTNFDIIAERFDPSGNRVPGGRVVISNSQFFSDLNPVVTPLADGGYIVAWVGFNSINYDIGARHITADDQLNGGYIAIKGPDANSQGEVELTTLSDGDVVAVWTDFGAGADVKFRILSPGPLGTFIEGPEQTVAGAGSAVWESDPHIAALIGGGFVITYVDEAGDANGSGIRAVRYDSSGNAQGSDFLVNTGGTFGDQSESRVAALDDGGFVVMWSDNGLFPANGIHGQRFFSNGAVAGPRFTIEIDKGANTPTFPDIAMLNDGRFVVSYTDYTSDFSNSEIKASIWDPSSRQVTLNGENARTITLSNGNILVVWQAATSALFFDPGDVYGQIFNSAMLPVSGILQLNSAPHNNDEQVLPDVAALPGGGFVVTYLDRQASGGGIIAEIYDSSGNPAATNQQYQITFDPGAQLTSEPRVTAFDDGSFSITYTLLTNDGDYDVKGTHINSFGQQLAQHYDVYAGQPDIDSQFNGALATLPDGRMVSLWEYNSSITPTSHGLFFTIMDDDGLNRILGFFDDFVVGTATSLEAVFQPDVAGLNVDINGFIFPGFVAVWTDEAIEAAGYGIHAAVMIYDIGLGTAAPVTTNFIRVNQTEAGTQLRPRVGVLNDGTFMVAWESIAPGSGEVTVHARQFDAFGNALSDEVQILGPSNFVSDINILSNGVVYVTTEDGDHVTVTPFFDPPNPTPLDDVLTGTVGIDTIDGLAGNDTIYGLYGNDVLIGGGGNDYLFGDLGFDRLVGGTGQDTLVGSLHADIFDFNNRKEMTNNVATTDVILDFEILVDHIDLSTIDASTVLRKNNAFVWRGEGGFTKSKAGEIRFKQFDNPGTGNDYTLVFGDTDRDKRSEFVIKLDGLVDLTKDDFIL